jgi:hypothetical protein
MLILNSDYLTGFHKRKVQKKEAEKKAAIAKQKRIRRETRAEVFMFLLNSHQAI